MSECATIIWHENFSEYRHRNAQVKASAFTAAELGEILPAGSWTMRLSKNWMCFCNGTPSLRGIFKTEAEARAAKLIDLIERGVLSVEEVNSRLGAPEEATA